MMFELNNREVLQVVLQWLAARQLTSAEGAYQGAPIV
jgi:hypothetical protein